LSYNIVKNPQSEYNKELLNERSQKYQDTSLELSIWQGTPSLESLGYVALSNVFPTYRHKIPITLPKDI